MPASPATSTSGRVPVTDSAHASSSSSSSRVRPTSAWRSSAAASGAGHGVTGIASERAGATGATGASPAQHALVDDHRGLAGRRAELVAQQDPQLLERAQRLGRVAGRLVHLHQQPVGGLAERRGGDHRAGGLLGGAELAAALAQARLAERLERAQPDALQLAPQLVQPRAVAVGEEGLQVDGEGVAGARRGLGPVVRVDRALGAGGGAGGELEVDLDVRARDEAQLGAAGERALAECLAELGEQRAERRVRRSGRLFRPQQVDQLGPAAVAIAVQQQVGEQQATLPTRQCRTHGATVALHAHRPAEPYDPPHRLTHYVYDATTPPRFLQGFANRRPASSVAQRREALRRCGLRHGRCETHIAGPAVARRHPHPPKGSSDPRSPAMAPSSPHPPDGAARRTPTDPRPTADSNVRRARREAGPSSFMRSRRVPAARRRRGRPCPRSRPRSG